MCIILSFSNLVELMLSDSTHRGKSMQWDSRIGSVAKLLRVQPALG